VRILLDTHVFLWLHTEPERLGDHLATVEDARTELVVSAASSWEIAIKHGLGRLPLPEPPEHYVPERIRVLAAQGVSIEHSHALAVARLPRLHRDPFDRLLVAQAGVLDLTILTADPDVARYPVRSLLIGCDAV
jgi:PIN domain nuclease of toxin-antitoxin system